MRVGLLVLVLVGWMGGCITRERSTGYRGSPSGKEVKDLPGGNVPASSLGSPSSGGGGGRGDGGGGKGGSGPGSNQGTSPIVGTSTGLHLVAIASDCSVRWAETPLLSISPTTCDLADAVLR
jgi:hypothetical protein